MYGSKQAWLLCAGRKLLVFSVGIDWLGFCVVEIDLVIIWRPEVTWFWCDHRNFLGSCEGGWN